MEYLSGVRDPPHIEWIFSMAIWFHASVYWIVGWIENNNCVTRNIIIVRKTQKEINRYVNMNSVSIASFERESKGCEVPSNRKCHSLLQTLFRILFPRGQLLLEIESQFSPVLRNVLCESLSDGVRWLVTECTLAGIFLSDRGQSKQVNQWVAKRLKTKNGILLILLVQTDQATLTSYKIKL